MGSEYREPSEDTDRQYPNVASVPSPATAASQQGAPSGGKQIEEPGYREHGVIPTEQRSVEGPSFYPADLPDRQLQEEQRHTSIMQLQQNGAYPSVQGQQQQVYRGIAPTPMPAQRPAPFVPNPLYPQYPPQAPSGQHYGQYKSAPASYTNPQTYQYPPAKPVQPLQQQVYPGYPPQGYYAPYGQSVYPGYPYPWYPPRPKRDGYQLGVAIASLVGSILVVLGGAFCGIVLWLASLATTTTTRPASAVFASSIVYIALMVAGVVGGIFGILHSSFALAQRPSRPFKLPQFWIFLLVYIALIVVGFMVGSSNAVINNLFLAFPLIALCGILPALTFLALALRRLRRLETREWPTTWRRFTLALVSGATSAIFLAIIFELILTVVAVFQFGAGGMSFIDNPNAPTPHDPRIVVFMLMIVSVIAPIVEESFKPLAVIVMIGRIRSAAEAFILGMACGIGFDIIETAEYMGTGYHNWISIAIDRSTSGLLHGFGAGMMALGWYYITHKDALKQRHIQIGLGCMLYAILQHAIWNGSFVLQLLPAPIGPYLEKGTIPIFSYKLDAFLIVYIVFSLLILYFLWFVTGKIRLQPNVPFENKSKPVNQTNEYK